MSHLEPENIEVLAASGAPDPHLETCAQCRSALVGARARRSLLKGLKDVTLSEAAFRRVEAKMMGELEKPVSAWGLVFSQLRNNWMLAAGVAAVVLLVVVPRLLETSAPVPPPTVAVQQPTPRVAPQHEVQLLAVLVEGPVLRNGAPLGAGDSIATGDQLDAHEGRVVLTDGKGELRLELMGEARIGGQATVALKEGTLAVDGSGPVLVEAGAWIGGTDSAFVVNRVAAEVLVDVLRGQALVGSDSALRDSTSLVAPAQLRVPLPAQRPFGSIGHEPAPYPFAARPAGAWGRLDLNGLPLGTTFDVDGQRVGGAPASVLLALGRHKVRTQAPGQPGHEAWVELVAGSATTFKPAPRLEKEEAPPSEDAIANLQRSIRDQRPKLAACYEKWLKANPAASGEVELTLVLSRNGKVVGARVDQQTIPRESIDCLVRTAKTLRLPALGTEQEIAVPLHLTTSAH